LLINDTLPFSALNGPFVIVLLDVWVRQRDLASQRCGGAENANLNNGCRELKTGVEYDTGLSLQCPPCINVSSVDDTNLRFCCLYFR
jgi:hypothetical protein